MPPEASMVQAGYPLLAPQVDWGHQIPWRHGHVSSFDDIKFDAYMLGPVPELGDRFTVRCLLLNLKDGSTRGAQPASMRSGKAACIKGSPRALSTSLWDRFFPSERAESTHVHFTVGMLWGI